MHMRTTVTIDHALYEKALEMADPTMDKADLFREAIKAFVRIQAAKRLVALGGAAPDMPDIARRSQESLAQ
jgi:Arc/MetJ family transcription regulator